MRAAPARSCGPESPPRVPRFLCRINWAQSSKRLTKAGVGPLNLLLVGRSVLRFLLWQAPIFGAACWSGPSSRDTVVNSAPRGTQRGQTPVGPCPSRRTPTHSRQAHNSFLSRVSTREKALRCEKANTEKIRRQPCKEPESKHACWGRSGGSTGPSVRPACVPSRGSGQLIAYHGLCFRNF